MGGALALHPAMKHPLLITAYGLRLLQVASMAVAQSSLPPFPFTKSRGDSPPPPPVYVQKKLPQYALLAFILILMAGLCVLICVVKTKRMCMERQHLQSVSQGASQQGDAATQTPGLLRQTQGLEPALVQALPLFNYRKVGIPDAVGIKGHGDCPVCLSEFGEGDVVRLLPNCKHIFHRECIDTWLLSHPSCPLCRESVQLQKQSSLQKILTLLRGRSQREDLQGQESPQPGQPPLEAVSEIPPSAPALVTFSELSTTAPPIGLLPQPENNTSTRDAELGNPKLSVPLREGRDSCATSATATAAAHAAGTGESSEAAMLGGRGSRRPSEDIRWAMSDTLATTTPRVVKRSSSLGRDLATPRPSRMSAEDRRHSFGEMLRSSFKRDTNLSAPLPSQAEIPTAPAVIVRPMSNTREAASSRDIESGS